MDEPVAGVSAIAGLSSWLIRVDGESNHAGTTQLDDRRDALLPITRPTLTARQMMTEFPGTGGASNVVPGVINCTLDVRSCDEQNLEVATRKILDSLRESARDNRCSTELERSNDFRPLRWMRRSARQSGRSIRVRASLPF